MDVKLNYCFLAVDDHDKALAFYRDAVGLEVRNDVGFEGMRWVTVAAPGQDAEIVLEPPAMNPDASAADKQTIEDLMAKGLMGRVVFTVDDCDATFERVRASGAEVIQEPMDQQYGVRDCAFRDPSGNLARFNQKPKW
jgi:predicted enzyme related to lactoylglutathione lyase